MPAMKNACPDNEAGYNLLQLAIALLIFGVLFGTLMTAYNIYSRNQKITETNANLQTAINTIQGYRSSVGAYPCPSPLNVARNDPRYGRASNCRSSVFPLDPLTAVTGGNCTNGSNKGLCVQQSSRTLTNRRVIVGAIPFRDMQIDESATFDGYGSRMVYAVTESLTDKNTFDDRNGGINVLDESGNTLISPAASASFLVLSPGRTAVGAYAKNGALIAPCTGTSRDVRNCNVGFESGTSPSAVSQFIAAPLSETAGTNFFDDFVAYYSQVNDPAWRRTDAEKENIEDLSPNFVGIGTSVPAAMLDVSSVSATPVRDSIRVYGLTGTDGKLMADQYCNQAGADCFTPQAITSTSQLRCGTGYIRGIRNNAPVCISIIELTCPAATPVLQSVTSGNLNCVAVPGIQCPAASQTLCMSNDVSLPLSNHGATLNRAAGSCRQATYKCNGGVWSKTADNGQACSLGADYTVTGLACGPNYSGTYSETRRPTCTGYTVLSSTFPTTCTCTGSTSTQNFTCASGASYTRTTTVTCNPDGSTSTTTSDTSGTSCVCPTVSDPVTYTYANCPAGQLRSSTAPAAEFAQATSPEQGIFTRREYNSSPAVCGYEVKANGTYCECDPGTPRADRNKPHVCDNPVCEEPDPATPDVFGVTVNASCVETESLKTNGACRPKGFKWVSLGTDGSTATNVPGNARYVGVGCSCAQHQATTSSTQSCFLSSDPSKTIYNCSCQ